MTGFEGNSIYRVWGEASNTIIRSKDVDFIEEPGIVSSKGPGRQKRKRDLRIPDTYSQMDRRLSKTPRRDHGSVGEESAKTADDNGIPGRSEIDDDDDTITVDTSSRPTGSSVAALATTGVVPISGSDHSSGSGALSLPAYPTDIDVTSNKSLTYGSPPEISPSVGACQMAQAVALFTHTLRAAAVKANNDSINSTLGSEPQTWKQSQQTPEAD